MERVRGEEEIVCCGDRLIWMGRAFWERLELRREQESWLGER
jgi:hypothetical protein